MRYFGGTKSVCEICENTLRDTHVLAIIASDADLAEVIEADRAKKIVVIRYRQKSRYAKKRGHRQPYTKVRITAL